MIYITKSYFLQLNLTIVIALVKKILKISINYKRKIYSESKCLVLLNLSGYDFKCFKLSLDICYEELYIDIY